MNRKLLLGSILVLTLLLLIPSIPAIQQNIVKEDFKDKILSELPEDIDFREIKELVDSGKLDGIKHPLLYFIITGRLLSKIERAQFAGDKAFYVTQWGIVIESYFWLVVYTILFIDVGARALFWYYVSETFRWNWNLEEALKQEP